MLRCWTFKNLFIYCWLDMFVHSLAFVHFFQCYRSNRAQQSEINGMNGWLITDHIAPITQYPSNKFQIFVPPFNRLSKTDQKWFSHVSLPHKYTPHTLYCCFAYFIITLFHGKKHNNLELTMYEHITWLLLVCD